MVLDAEYRLGFVSQSFNRPVVQVDVRDFDVLWQRLWVDGKPVIPTDEQSKKMADYLGANWSKVIS